MCVRKKCVGPAGARVHAEGAALGAISSLIIHGLQQASKNPSSLWSQIRYCLFLYTTKPPDRTLRFSYFQCLRQKGEELTKTKLYRNFDQNRFQSLLIYFKKRRIHSICHARTVVLQKIDLELRKRKNKVPLSVIFVMIICRSVHRTTFI